MEKAIVLDKIAIKKADENLLKRYDIIYTGSEFCQNIMTAKKDIKRLFDLGAKKVAVQTSFMVMERLVRVQESVSDILENFKNIEIMINDFGLLLYLNKYYPRAVKVIARPLSIEFMRMNDKSLSKFMKENKISGIETDEPYMIGNFPLKRNFFISLHHPLKFVAMNRACPFIGKTTLDCGYKCSGKILKLKVPETDAFTLAINNAYFIKQDFKTPKGTDRLVKNF